MTLWHVVATLDLVEPKALLDVARKYGTDISATDIFHQVILDNACSWKNSDFVEASIPCRSSLKVSKDVFGSTFLCIVIKATRFFWPISLAFAKLEMPGFSFDLPKALLLSIPGKSMTKQEIDLVLLAPVKYHCENECIICFGRKPSQCRYLRKHIKENYTFFTKFISQELNNYMESRKEPT